METPNIAEMLPHQIIARLGKAPVAFIGLGTLEWHGEHLVLGTDGLKAQRLCELAAARSGGFAFPTIWAGEPQLRRFGKVSPGGDQGRRLKERLKRNLERLADGPYGTTNQQQIEAYKQMVYRRLVELNTMGIKAVCLVSGHYPLQARVSDVVEEFNQRFGETRVYVGREYHYAGGGPNAGGDHAGKWETSYMWHLWPGCVDLSIYRGRQTEPLVGVMGEDPRTEASLALGREACNLIVEGMVRKAEQLVREVDLNAAETSPVATRPVAASVDAADPQGAMVLQNGTNGYTGCVDTHIDDAHPDVNFGQEQHLWISAYYGYWDGSERQRTLIRFDVSGLAPHAAIRSARLKLHNFDEHGRSITYEAHELGERWAEDGVTWRSNAAAQSWTPGGAYASAVVARSVKSAAGVDEWMVWDVTDTVRKWIDQPASNRGLLLMGEPEYLTAANRFRSSEYADVSLRPKLVIELASAE